MGLVLAGRHGEGRMPGCHSARLAMCTAVLRYNAQQVAVIAGGIGGHVIPRVERYPGDEGIWTSTMWTWQGSCVTQRIASDSHDGFAARWPFDGSWIQRSICVGHAEGWLGLAHPDDVRQSVAVADLGL